MKSITLVDYGAPLAPRESPTPEPSGREVLVRVRHCGVCHSDVHLHDGYFELGDDRKLDLSGAHELPFTLGHEIVGTVAALGEHASGVQAGDLRVVYPWIGCGDCPVCERGDEHLCARPRALGVNRDGGYADHVLVPDARYLLEFGGIAADLAATCMCSGVTAYSALKKVAPLGAGQTLVIVGLGGVGFMGLQFARALYPEATLVAADVDADKLAAASAAGAARVYDSSNRDSVKQLIKESAGGARAAIDFVGATTSFEFAQRVVAKGGRVVVVGLFGGKLSMPLAMLPLRELALCGSYVGSLDDARELLALAGAGGVAPIPIENRQLDRAGESLDDLRSGRVLGRIVLDCQD